MWDKEVNRYFNERRPLQPDTFECSPEIVPDSVRHQSTIIPSFSVVAKKKKMSSNSTKMKREKEEMKDYCEEDWGKELYSNSSNFVLFDEFGIGELDTFGQMLFSLVYHGQFTASNVSDKIVRFGKHI